jgi:hypothetical protein
VFSAQKRDERNEKLLSRRGDRDREEGIDEKSETAYQDRRGFLMLQVRVLDFLPTHRIEEGSKA